MSDDAAPNAQWGDPVASRLTGEVHCDPEAAGGWAQARGLGVEGLSVVEALASFRIYRDPTRGIVSRVESIARGIGIDGVVRIDTIRGTGESSANGRRQPVAEDLRAPDSDPNCDMERTAGTCYNRNLFGLWTPQYRCGPCGNEQSAVDAMQRALGTNATVRLRKPDEDLAKGSQDGYIAAVQKPDSERFSDLLMNNDLLQTVLPALEIVRFAPGWSDGSVTGNTPAPPRGRQIIQFAGVEVSSSYGIQCLLVYDAETNTCAPAAVELGSLTVQLTDAAGAPLAGGAFEVRADVDGDGVVGLADELLTEGACATAEDGIGTCTFAGLEPGGYLVSQTAAPAGYSTVAEPWVSQLAPGEARTVTFTNISDVSVVEMTATDADGNPVAGAVFAVFPDPDADGRVAPDAVPVATCTTDADGVCAMSVPVGSYVLVQTVAPAGMEPIEPVAFAFASGGQTAAVGVVNQPAGLAGQPAAPVAASPIAYTPPMRTAPSESVAGYAGDGRRTAGQRARAGGRHRRAGDPRTR